MSARQTTVCGLVPYGSAAFSVLPVKSGWLHSASPEKIRAKAGGRCDPKRTLRRSTAQNYCQMFMVASVRIR